MSEFSKQAKLNYENGLSCSEAIITAAEEIGICKFNDINEIHKIASMFSNGMLNGCLCGALAGSQIVLGCIFGRNISERSKMSKLISAKFIQTFKEKRKTTCCRALSAPYRDNPVERRENCANIVAESAHILEDLVNQYSKEKINV